ncbi:uncharacterized protein LOC111343997 [Stylophora pistillata]|uniref:uncharacterized protein LOC111343997 n=1 Tax=Stylophora pistillata TaxID=50429 RepID=UPI000C0466F6|nr:uncharacterized protein LOC111343997 [Stylophora pistillata]
MANEGRIRPLTTPHGIKLSRDSLIRTPGIGSVEARARKEAFGKYFKIELVQCVTHRPQAECLDAAIKQYLEKPTDEVKIIDCGAGTGLCGVELHKLGYTHLCALDISPEMLNEARKKNVYQKFICAPLNSDQNPEVNTGEYDAMICFGTLCAAHVKATALMEMIRMIKIGGLISFNIRLGEVERYQPMIEELEKEGKWLNAAKKTIPHYQRGDITKTSLSCLQNPEALMRQLTR